MGKLFESIRGTVRAELCGAFPEAVLNACALRALELWEIESVDEHTLRVTLYEKRLQEFEAAAEKSGCQVAVLGVQGGSKNRVFLRQRVWLLVSLALAGALLTLSSLFIWEIDIRGNKELTEGELLRALEDCGVTQGSYWPGLSADLVRSRMLTRLPELAWMTVNVSGSRAIVLIEERQEKPEIYQESSAVDIVAKKTGIISKMSVLNGKPLTGPGQSVLQGETLVTGVMDSITNAPRLVRARADVIADTWYELTAVSPAQVETKAGVERRFSRFALKIGKKRINFYLGDGKQLDEWDKIVYEYNLGIKGLFALPVTVVREEWSLREKSLMPAGRVQEMQERLYAALAGSIDGEIVSSGFSVSETEKLTVVTLRAQCRENIASTAPISDP